MTPINPTLLAQANAALRNKDYKAAIALNEKALDAADAALKTQIRFNLDLARRRAGQKVQRESTHQSIQFELKPLYQIECDAENPGRWVSLGHDPHFTLERQKADHITAGWYLIELNLETPQKRNFARLYPDYGEGLSEETSIQIYYKSAHAVTHVIKFDRDVKHLRFDPFDKPGVFYIPYFRIQQLTEEQALAAMTAALTVEENNQPVAENKVNLLDDLYKKYTNKLNIDAGAPSYQQWIEEVEHPSLPSAVEVSNTLAQMRIKPLISVVMPTYNTAEKHLRTCIESVINQIYPHWELCIADDASPLPHVRRVLDEYKQFEPRIKVVYRQENGHISRASNSALKLAEGSYVALLDHDDELPQHALYCAAVAINEAPEAQVIYSDEDKIDDAGIRSRPHFKSDWNPDLFYSQNYVCHLGVYKRELLNRIGGFRTGVEGSQDQDLLLRCLPHVENSQILHIPRVLYHWRATAGSTALASGEKSYTTQAGIKALENHFIELGRSDVKIEAGFLPNTYRVCWPIPEPAPLVSLLIPTRDKKEVVALAVESILAKTTYSNYEILIIDNGSTESATLEWFKQIQKDKRVRVLRYDHPFNYSAINNFGAKFAKGEILGLVNNDIEVISPNWLAEMTSHALRSEIGCVGAKLYYPNNTIQHGGIIMGLLTLAGHAHKHFNRNSPGYFGRLINTQNFEAVTAACLLIKKDIYNEAGGLNESLKVAFNDVDFCLRVQQLGYRNLWTPFAELYHHESISRGMEDTPEKKIRFEQEVNYMQKNWTHAINKSRYYNPNLTKDKEDFSLGV